MPSSLRIKKQMERRLQSPSDNAQSKARRFCKTLPPAFLEHIPKNLEDRLEALFSIAPKTGGASFARPEFKDEARRVFAFSEFVAGFCVRNPEAFFDLLSSGDLLARRPPPKPEENPGEKFKEKLEEKSGVPGLDPSGLNSSGLNPSIGDPSIGDSSGLKKSDSKKPILEKLDIQAILPEKTSAPLSLAEIQKTLRLFRNREMVRIAWRDISGRADLFETMEDLSSLADACLDWAIFALVDDLSVKWGIPHSESGARQNLVALGMGKLGGRELNFSSDIDLILTYPEKGQTQGGQKTCSNEEFFVRLSALLAKAIGEKTVDGFVFRVDLRLRPNGDGGPLAMSFQAMEDYYERHGREWERYAMIKARVVAGDKVQGARLMSRLIPFVFRRYLDFGVFESLREMKRMITLDMKRKKMAGHIKLGPGGIREVEFFGQVFQLIRGGISMGLRGRGILSALGRIEEENLIPGRVRKELSDAYIFLRIVENRLQEFSDLKAHSLPTDVLGRLRLAASTGFSDWESFQSVLDEQMRHVHEHFNGLLKLDDESSDPSGILDAMKSVWRHFGDDGAATKALSAAGYERPDDVIRRMKILKGSPATKSLGAGAEKLLDRLVPLAIQETAKSPDPSVSIIRILDFINAIERRACYLSLLLENRVALEHLIQLSAASSWILSFLSRHPALLDELLDPRTLYFPPGRADIETALARRLDLADPDDLEFQMEALSIFRQVHVLRVAAADITGSLPLMKVSDHLSIIAEVVLNDAARLCRERLVKKYGEPSWSDGNNDPERGFAVIAYGKLGGVELGYGSDMDLVFVHGAEPGRTGDPDHGIDNAQFFVRLGQRMISMLTSPTSAGIVYKIDMRLRPGGSSGTLVSDIEALRQYQLNDAWTWETQALTRARAICGDTRLVDRFGQIRREVLCCPRNGDELRLEVSDMRRRMRDAHIKIEPGQFDLKHGDGGLIDIEFIVQFLTLLHAHKKPDLIEFTDNIRITSALMETGVISENSAHFLKQTYLSFRAMIHRLNLREAPGLVSDRRFPILRAGVRRVWAEVFGETFEE